MIRDFVAVVSCITVYGVTAGLSTPLISLNLEARDAGALAIGLNASMLALALLFLSPAVPWLIARLGFRPLMVLALGVEASCFLLLPTSDNLWFWMLVRIVMGASVTVLFVVGETWINEIADERTRGRFIAIYMSALSLSFAIGPLLIPFTGINGWLPFVVTAGIILTASLPLLAANYKQTNAAQVGLAGPFSFMRQSTDLCGAVLAFGFIWMASIPLLPVYAVRLGYSEELAAAMIAAVSFGGFCLQYPIGWFADRYDRNLLLLTCALSALAGALLLPLAIHLSIALWPLLFLWGGLLSGIYTLAMVLLGERYRGSDLANGNAAFGMLWGAGSLAGPIAGGWAMGLFGPHGLPLCMAAVTLVYVVQLRLSQRRKSAQDR